MRLRPTTTVFGVSLTLLVALCFVAANAQSGRRQAKPPAVAPVPTPTPEATPVPTPKRDENAVNFLKGQVMKASRGKANPQIVDKVLREKLNAMKG